MTFISRTFSFLTPCGTTRDTSTMQTRSPGYFQDGRGLKDGHAGSHFGSTTWTVKARSAA